MFLLSMIFVMPMLLNTYYIFGESGLYICGGLFKITIPYEKIQSAKLTKNPLASPYTLSISRLRIGYMNKNSESSFLLISPKYRQKFIEQLSELNPNVVI